MKARPILGFLLWLAATVPCAITAGQSLTLDQTGGQSRSDIAAPEARKLPLRQIYAHNTPSTTPNTLVLASPFFPQQLSPVLEAMDSTPESNIESHMIPIDPNDLPASSLVAEDLQDTRKQIADENGGNLAELYNQLLETILESNCESAEALKNSPNFSKDQKFELCSSNIANEVFAPLGESRSSYGRVFNHLRNNIYRPLGYKLSPYKFTYADTINDLLNLDDLDQTIHKDMPMPSPAQFKAQIVNSIRNVQSSSNDFDLNKLNISDQIMNVLKSLHIFWNYHRQRNQMNVTKSATLSIIRQMIQQFRESDKEMHATTVNILENVRDAFVRFMKAHKMREHFRAHPAETVAGHFVRRYRDYAERIKDRRADTFSLVQELAVFLDLLRAFQLINYKTGKSPGESLADYERLIAVEITRAYDQQWKYLVETGHSAASSLSDFTAVLLLKMRMRNHIIFNKYRIENYALLPSSALHGSFAQASRLYYELMDSVSLVPSDCNELNGPKLDDCVSDKLELYLVQINQKYMLHTSLARVDLYEFVRGGLDMIVDQLRAGNLFREFNVFRNEFFTWLYGFSEQLRHEYQIRDMRAVAELESEIGFQIEKAKTGERIPTGDFAHLDALDQSLYDFFLGVKCDFNKYAPVTRDASVMREIVARLKARIAEFYRPRKDKVTPEFKQLLLTIAREGQVWTRKHSVKFVVNSHPSNYNPELLNVITINDPESETPYEFANQPLLNANAQAGPENSVAGMLAQNPFLPSSSEPRPAA